MSRGKTKTDIVAVPGKWVPSSGEMVVSDFEASPGTVTRTFNQYGQDIAVVCFGTQYGREVYLSMIRPVT